MEFPIFIWRHWSQLRHIRPASYDNSCYGPAAKPGVFCSSDGDEQKQLHIQALVAKSTIERPYEGVVGRQPGWLNSSVTSLL